VPFCCISINAAQPIAAQLAKSGKVSHASLGVSFIPLSPAISAQRGLDQAQGVVILRVPTGSNAATAGLRRGDVITAVDGKPIKDDSALALLLRDRQPGDKLTLTIKRSGQNIQAQVALSDASS
jgi:S1-C subfamily serine protease